MKRLFILIAAAVSPTLAILAEEPVSESVHFEAEFAASDIFRSGSLVLPLARRIAFEGHHFGGQETDTGFTGVSCTLTWKGLTLTPGLGVLFGSNEFAATPAVSFRWEYERKWFITQGLVVQGFRETPIFAEKGEADSRSNREPASFVRPTISDGNHLSVRWR